eukprot:scaffold4875_cov155-Amphora_coffeaeformis.AAC.9
MVWIESIINKPGGNRYDDDDSWVLVAIVRCRCACCACTMKWHNRSTWVSCHIYKLGGGASLP